MKKKTFLPYHRWPLMLFGAIMLLAVMCGVAVCFIGAFISASESIWVALLLLFGALCAAYAGMLIAYDLFLELSITAAPITVSEKGVSMGWFRRKNYRWEEVTQFGVTMVDPPPRKHPIPKAEYEWRPRSIYLVFGFPDEEPASEWQISRLGAIEFWQRCYWPKKAISHIENFFCILAPRKSNLRGKFDDYTKDVYFPKRFIAMKYSPERFALINSYLQKAERGTKRSHHT